MPMRTYNFCTFSQLFKVMSVVAHADADCDRTVLLRRRLQIECRIIDDIKVWKDGNNASQDEEQRKAQSLAHLT